MNLLYIRHVMDILRAGRNVLVQKKKKLKKKEFHVVMLIFVDTVAVSLRGSVKKVFSKV